MRILRISLVIAALVAASPALAQEYRPTARDIQAMTHIIYGEARGEPVEGKCIVGWSMIFRAQTGLAEYGGSDLYNIAYKVTRSSKTGKLTWQYDGAKASVDPNNPDDMRDWQKSRTVAEGVLSGYCRPSVPIMYFCVPGSCGWHDKHEPYVDTIGVHQLYVDRRFPDITMFN